MNDYRYVATSVEGFIQQIAVSYVRHGYVFFVTGRVPDGKDPLATDKKLLSRYQIKASKDVRYRRKKLGKANLQYIRFGRTWVMLATRGEHEFFSLERANIRDVRRQPLILFGYSISLTRGGFIKNRDRDPGALGPVRDEKPRVRVQISKSAFRELRAELFSHARTRSMEWYRMRFFHIGFEPYAPVRKQLLDLLRQVNKARAPHGLPKISPDCIRYHRNPRKPFELMQTRANLLKQLTLRDSCEKVELPQAHQLLT